MKVIYTKGSYRIIEVYEDCHDMNDLKGWKIIDTCHGFIGHYDNEKHYIVEEFKKEIDNASL